MVMRIQWIDFVMLSKIQQRRDLNLHLLKEWAKFSGRRCQPFGHLVTTATMNIIHKYTISIFWPTRRIGSVKLILHPNKHKLTLSTQFYRNWGRLSPNCISYIKFCASVFTTASTHLMPIFHLYRNKKKMYISFWGMATRERIIIIKNKCQTEQHKISWIMK